MSSPTPQPDPTIEATNQELTSPVDWAQHPDLLTVTEAMRILRVGRNTAYEAIHRGELPHIKLGRRILVPKHALMLKLGVTPPDSPMQHRAAKTATAASPHRGGYLPSPQIKSIRLDRFPAAFADTLVCGAEMPDGSLWLLDESGTRMTISQGR